MNEQIDSDKGVQLFAAWQSLIESLLMISFSDCSVSVRHTFSAAVCSLGFGKTKVKIKSINICTFGHLFVSHVSTFFFCWSPQLKYFHGISLLYPHSGEVDC